MEPVVERPEFPKFFLSRVIQKLQNHPLAGITGIFFLIFVVIFGIKVFLGKPTYDLVPLLAVQFGFLLADLSARN
jgi:hypothetical protein